MNTQILPLAASQKPASLSSGKSIKDVYLNGIINNDSHVIERIYSTYFPTIRNYIIKNNGSSEEAFDVFQDGMHIILKKTKRKDFELTSSFHTYLYSVCRLVWLKQLKKNGRKLEKHYYDEGIEYEIEKDIDDRAKERLFKSKMKLLSPESRQVLELFFNKTSMEDIAQIMGYTVEYAKRKKYKAKNKLVQLIKADKAFHHYYE